MCYEPTDENKASKPFLSDSWKALTYISPNLQELRAINQALGNPLPAGIEHSGGSVRLSENLDPGEERFLLQPASNTANWIITWWGFISAHGILHLTAISVWAAWTDDLSEPTGGLGWLLAQNQRSHLPHFIT